MNKSIISNYCKILQEISNKNLKSLVEGASVHKVGTMLYKDILDLACLIFKNNLETLDLFIKEKPERINRYKVDGKTHKKLLLEFGEVNFEKTRYFDIKTNEYLYLIDKYINIDSFDRMTDGVRRRVLEESIQTSYKKGGNCATETIPLSKGTTKNIIDSLDEKLIKVIKYEKVKRIVEYLYIDLDEAHINIQTKGKYKKNIISKLVYIYEGKEKDNFKGKRSHLINPYYISGIYAGSKGNIDLSKEILDYINDNYDVSKIKKIYVQGDGARWIKEVQSLIPNSYFVMDEFHMYKYMKSGTSHLKDSQSDAISDIYKAIKHSSLDELDMTFNLISSYTKDKKDEKNIYESYTYFRDNFDSIVLRLSNDKNIIGCSAEGHVSHVLADRMTSRPMGWSISNANKMSKLRAYVLNGGSITDLLEENRYNINYELDFGLERVEEEKYIQVKSYYKDIYSSFGKYYDNLQAELTDQIRKKFYIQGIL